MNKQKRWICSPPKPPKAKVPGTVKREVEDRATKIIEGILKPKHIKPPSDNNTFNYIVDIYSKWHQNYFYFIAKYSCPGPNAVSPFFESKFARMRYIGNERFNLSYMRHTEQWFEIYSNLSVDECLKAITEDPHFLP
ncbi:MAG: hypothetical protein PHH77_10000 [Victivallaceae bacterium]|nr:hypothetical protein [Victivallaceae bacterium]